MQPRVMITNGGTHSPQKWAEATAWKILDLVRVPDEPVDAAIPEMDRLGIEQHRETMRAAKNIVEQRIADVLVEHHKQAQDGERAALDTDGDGSLANEIDAAVYVEVDRAATEVGLMFLGTPLAPHFAQGHVKARLREIIDQQLRHTMQVERGVFVDQNPDGDNAKALIAARAA